MALVPHKRLRELVAKKELTEEEEKEFDFLCEAENAAISNIDNDDFNPLPAILFSAWASKL